jgi:hypothetical protein
MKINKSKYRRRPEGRRNKQSEVPNENFARKPVSVRSISGLSYPIRGKLGRELAEERS